MTTGSPDYGIVANQVNEPQSSDTLELAAREGIYIPYSRSGNVLFNLHPVLFARSSQFNGSAGWYWIPSSNYAFFGYDYSIKYVCSSGSGSWSGASFNPPITNSQQYGLMTYFGSTAYNAAIYFKCLLNIANVRHDIELRFTFVNGYLEYYGADSAYHTILIQNMSSFSTWPLILKYTFNIATGKYGKLWFNTSTALDLSQYSYNQSANPGADSFNVQIVMDNNEAYQNYFYLQDAIVTINEVI
jgi:hypothetical protein